MSAVSHSTRIAAFLLFILIFGSFFTPQLAQASVISDISSWVSGVLSGTPISPAAAVAEVYQNPDNSQTAPLLQAPVNSNPTPLADADDVAMVGDEALVNETGPDGSIADIDGASSTQISVYQVRPGDTLSSVAQMFGVSVNTIRGANDISGSIKPGDSLIILPITGIEYTVKNTDTAGSIAAAIAAKYGADVGDILNYNNLDSNSVVTAGTSLIIPDVDASSSVTVTQAASGTTKKPTTKSSSTKSGGNVSTMKSSDPLYNPVHNDTNLPDYVGYYKPPVKKWVLTQGLHGYNAVDMATPQGSAIYAAADGKVIIAKTGGYNGGYGNYVVIQHNNGTQTLYAHMETVLATVGETVTQGEQIGKVGMTGLATGPHVHFEVRGAVNPFGQ